MSIIGFDPDLTVNCTSDRFFVYDRNNRVINKFKVKEPLSCLKKIVPIIKESRFRYAGGAVGYISYDAVRFWEHLPIKDKGQKHFPLLEFGIYTDGLLYDHAKNRAYYFYIGDKSRLQAIEEITRKTQINDTQPFSYSTPKSNLSRSQFIKIVNPC